jgi:hypothetical protein
MGVTVKAFIFDIIQDDGYLMERLDAARQNGWSLWSVTGEVERWNPPDLDAPRWVEHWHAYVYGADVGDALIMANRRFQSEPDAFVSAFDEDDVAYMGEID